MLAKAANRQIFYNIPLFGKHLNTAISIHHDIIQQLRKTVNVMGAENQIHMTIRFQQLGNNILLLCHASAQSKQQVRLLAFQALQGADFPQYLILRIFSDSACIHQNQIRILGMLHRSEIHLLQNARQCFTVPFIRLTAIRTQIIFLSLSQQSNLLRYLKQRFLNDGFLGCSYLGILQIGKCPSRLFFHNQTPIYISHP